MTNFFLASLWAVRTFFIRGDCLLFGESNQSINQSINIPSSQSINIHVAAERKVEEVEEAVKLYVKVVSSTKVRVKPEIQGVTKNMRMEDELGTFKRHVRKNEQSFN